MNQAINKSVWVRCRECTCNTIHSIRCEYIQTTIPEENNQLEQKDGERPLFVWTMSQIIECSCCGRPSFRHGWTSTPYLNGTWVWRIYSNPGARSPLLAVRCLPTEVGKLYHETWQAYHCGAFTLATVGMRAVVEAVCNDRHCRGADLQHKIKSLNGALSDGDIDLLQTHRALGNAAVHQMETPSAAELDAALDVLEHLLKTLYELPLRAADLKRLRADRLRCNDLSLAEAS